MNALTIVEKMHKEALTTLSSYLREIGHDADKWSVDQTERAFFLLMQVQAAHRALARVAVRDREQNEIN